MDPRRYGDTPADGDFARLLELASRPAAHRLTLDPSLGDGTGSERGAARRRLVQAAADWGKSAGAAGGAASRAEAARDGDASGEDARAAAPYGPPGMAEGRARAPARAAASGPGRLGRIVFLLIALWVFVAFVNALTDAPVDNLGALVVLGAVIWFALSRARRRPPGSSS